MADIEKKVEKAEEKIKEAVCVIEDAKDTVLESEKMNGKLLSAAKDLEKAEDSAIIACEATEEAEFKLKE